MRTNQGYTITDSIRVGEVEYVIGVNMEAPNPYVTWACKDEINYYWGHYLNDSLAAIKDLCERVAEQVQRLEEQQRIVQGSYEPKDNDDSVIMARVQYGNNSAFIPFPNNELNDILGSIGITAPSENVYLRQEGYDVKLWFRKDDRVAEGLAKLLTDKNSIRMINELTGAVYNGDFRLYHCVLRGFEIAAFQSPEDVLRDVRALKKELKARGEERGR